jgi:hypothetical protein
MAATVPVGVVQTWSILNSNEDFRIMGTTMRESLSLFVLGILLSGQCHADRSDAGADLCF